MKNILDIHSAFCKKINFVPRNQKLRPSAPPFMAGRIEHTALGFTVTKEDIQTLCQEALSHSFRAVCCMPKDVAFCCKALENTDVSVVTVVDFPLGGGTRQDGTSQCKRAVELGADEIDMVIDLRAVRESSIQMAADGVASIVDAAQGHPVKVILETSLLTTNQIILGAVAAEAGGAHFIKTNTGFGNRGASIQDISIMRKVVGDRLGVKAAGGIKDKITAQKMIEEGADVIGTSSGCDCI